MRVWPWLHESTRSASDLLGHNSQATSIDIRPFTATDPCQRSWNLYSAPVGEVGPREPSIVCVEAVAPLGSLFFPYTTGGPKTDLWYTRGKGESPLFHSGRWWTRSTSIIHLMVPLFSLTSAPLSSLMSHSLHALADARIPSEARSRPHRCAHPHKPLRRTADAEESTFDSLLQQLPLQQAVS